MSDKTEKQKSESKKRVWDWDTHRMSEEEVAKMNEELRLGLRPRYVVSIRLRRESAKSKNGH